MSSPACPRPARSLSAIAPPSPDTCSAIPHSTGPTIQTGNTNPRCESRTALDRPSGYARDAIACGLAPPCPAAPPPPPSPSPDSAAPVECPPSPPPPDFPAARCTATLVPIERPKRQPRRPICIRKCVRIDAVVVIAGLGGDHHPLVHPFELRRRRIKRLVRRPGPMPDVFLPKLEAALIPERPLAIVIRRMSGAPKPIDSRRVLRHPIRQPRQRVLSRPATPTPAAPAPTALPLPTPPARPSRGPGCRCRPGPVPLTGSQCSRCASTASPKPSPRIDTSNHPPPRHHRIMRPRLHRQRRRPHRARAIDHAPTGPPPLKCQPDPTPAPKGPAYIVIATASPAKTTA